MLKVLLVRHAQCEMNLHITERIGGRTNASPLTTLGDAQARALGAHLQAALLHAGTPPQQLQFYSSTAVRAVATAKHVMAALQVGGWGQSPPGGALCCIADSSSDFCAALSVLPIPLPLTPCIRQLPCCPQLDEAELVQSEQLLELEQGQWEGAVRRECYTPELTAQFAADPWVRTNACSLLLGCLLACTDRPEPAHAHPHTTLNASQPPPLAAT